MFDTSARAFDYRTIEFIREDGSTGEYAEITGYNGCDADIIVPAEIDGYAVKSIASGAFAGNTVIRTCDMPASLRDICFDAFNGCTSLGAVHIPSGVVYVGNRAFMGCPKLTYVRLHASLELIGDKAFGYAADGSKLADFEMFCKKHTPAYRYAKVNRLSITKTGALTDMFRYSIEDFTDSESGETVKAACITSYCGFDENVIVPSEIGGCQVKLIDGCAFADSRAKTVIVPEGVEKIFSGAFRGCKRLESIFLPETVNYIGSYAFKDCAMLTKVVIPQDAEVCGSAFDTCA